MADLHITDGFGLNASVDLNDDSPFAKLKLSHISSLRQALKDEISKPIDQTSLKSFDFGADWSTPTSSLTDGVTVTGGAGVSGAISIVRPADKTLFPDDNKSPKIELTPDQCWVGIEINATAKAGVQASGNGFGAGIKGDTKLALTTHTLIQRRGDKFPVLLDALKAALDNFYIANTTAALRAMPLGIACVSELDGAVTITGSYQLPISVNALASADLPFNETISVQPADTVSLTGSIAFSGDLIVRTRKLNADTLEIGVYKKHGTTLTAAFTAEAGVELDLGSTDIAAPILKAVFPGANTKDAGVTGDDALDDALSDSVDRSLSISMNAACSAATTDEAAVIYQLDLSATDADATDAALKSALRGDWTLLAKLPNARFIRNIVTDAKEYKHKIAINLFGIYNAEDVATYLRSSTILHDGDGQISVIDKASASRISVASTPYAANPDKLRTALAQDFLATMTYAIVASKLQAGIAIQQSYFLYDKALTRQEMIDQILLGAALQLFTRDEWTGTLAANPVFPHAHISATAKYDNAAALKLFFADPAQHTARTRADLERVGRNALIASIDPNDPAGTQRLAVLNEDQTWSAMDANGNTGAFKTIPGLTQLPAPVLGAVAADWTAIAWWADAMTQVAPRLAGVLNYLANVPPGDFSTDPDFMARRKTLQVILASVAKNTHAAFAGGWGMAVTYALAGPNAERTIDITWSSQTKHYEANE
jgi:hypothetical protein